MPKEFTYEEGFHPFGDMIGLDFSGFGEGYSECRLKVSEDLLNPHGVLHGGIVYSMADTGMGAALYSLMEEEELCATVEVKISYFSEVKSGELICETTVVNKGKKIANLESEIKKDDKLIAKATGTYYVFTPKNK